MQKNPHIKTKVQQMFQTCQDEIKRATEIGKKMLSASKTNTELHEAYEALGVMAYQALKRGELKWDGTGVTELVGVIERCEKNLESMEEQVQKIKFAAGPVDVSAVQTEEDKKVD